MSNPKIQHLREQIAALSKELHDLQQQELERASPFKVGDVIEWQWHGHPMLQGVVLRAACNCGATFDLHYHARLGRQEVIVSPHHNPRLVAKNEFTH